MADKGEKIDAGCNKPREGLGDEEGKKWGVWRGFQVSWASVPGIGNCGDKDPEALKSLTYSRTLKRGPWAGTWEAREENRARPELWGALGTWL
jgi:hypothetical protein